MSTDETLEALTEEAKEVVAEAGQEALIELIGDGLDQDEAQALLVQILDGVLAWRLFIAEPLASALEANDGPAISKALEALPALLDLFDRDPDKIDARADRAEERGHPKVAARRRARAQRVRGRQEKTD